MKINVLKIIASSVLGIEGIIHVSQFFSPFQYQNNIVLAVESLLFFVLAYFSYIKFHNRGVQWVSIILSLLRGVGGFLGLGWLCALILMIVYIVGDRQKTQDSAVNVTI